MALLWSQKTETAHYEVRSAGATIRLYRNGVNHSQWNPRRPLAGGIWDLLALPALHRPRGCVEKILILGFGAGSVGRQLKDLVRPDQITGIDFDPVHLSIAHDFFNCADGCELVQADAVKWVHNSGRDGHFDLIIDDLYSESDGCPIRHAPLDREWCGQLIRLLNPGGLLVFNFVDPGMIADLPLLKDPDLRQYMPVCKVFHMPGYDNHIVVCTEVELDRNQLESELERIYKEYPGCRGVAKRYRSFDWTHDD